MTADELLSQGQADTTTAALAVPRFFAAVKVLEDVL